MYDTLNLKYMYICGHILYVKIIGLELVIFITSFLINNKSFYLLPGDPLKIV